MSLGLSQIIDVTSKAGPEGKDGRGPDTPWKIPSVYRFPYRNSGTDTPREAIDASRRRCI